jgi:hypothetical protein
MSEILCEWFREMAPELAFGTIEPHWTTELLDHAAGCLGCQAELDQLSLIGDRLLSAGPQILPPTDFEDRAVAGMLPAPRAASPSPGRGRRVALMAAAAAAVVGLAVGDGYLAGQHRSGQTAHPASAAGLAGTRAGAIIRADGTVAGTITLAAYPRPLALVTVDNPRSGIGVVTCELVAADGQATTIGTWSFDEISRGAWAVGIDPALLTAPRMNIRNTAGTVLASAVLH